MNVKTWDSYVYSEPNITQTAYVSLQQFVTQRSTKVQRAEYSQ